MKDIYYISWLNAAIVSLLYNLFSFKIFTVLQKVLGSGLFNYLFKPTVYKNFIAGNTKVIDIQNF